MLKTYQELTPGYQRNDVERTRLNRLRQDAMKVVNSAFDTPAVKQFFTNNADAPREPEVKGREHVGQKFYRDAIMTQIGQTMSILASAASHEDPAAQESLEDLKAMLIIAQVEPVEIERVTHELIGLTNIFKEDIVDMRIADMGDDRALGTTFRERVAKGGSVLAL